MRYSFCGVEGGREGEETHPKDGREARLFQPGHGWAVSPEAAGGWPVVPSPMVIFPEEASPASARLPDLGGDGERTSGKGEND